MFSKKHNLLSKTLGLAALAFIMAFTFVPQANTMGGKAENGMVSSKSLEKLPAAGITPHELGELFWPDSNATEVQLEEALKNLQGKRVTWEIVVAGVQRKDGTYFVQGQSSREMIGTFVYIKPESKEDEQKLLTIRRDDKITVTGIAKELQERHIVLDPAFLVAAQE